MAFTKATRYDAATGRAYIDPGPLRAVRYNIPAAKMYLDVDVDPILARFVPGTTTTRDKLYVQLGIYGQGVNDLVATQGNAATRLRQIQMPRSTTVGTVPAKNEGHTRVRKAIVPTLPTLSYQKQAAGGGGTGVRFLTLTAFVHANATRLRTIQKNGTAPVVTAPTKQRFFYFSKLATPQTQPKRLRVLKWSKMDAAGVGLRGILLRFNVAQETEKSYNFGKILSGRYGSPVYRSRLYIVDQRGKQQELIKGVRTASLSLSNERDDTWNLSFDLTASDQLDPWADYVMPVVEAKMPDGKFEDFPLGVYRMGAPSIEYLRTHKVWSLDGASKEILLMEDQPIEGGIKVPKGTAVLATVRAGLIAYGFDPSTILFPQTDVTTLNDVVLAKDEGDDLSYLLVWNQLLKAGGFAGLKTDNYGNWTTIALDVRDVDTPDVTYTSKQRASGDRMIVDSISEEFDNELFANRIIATAQDVKQQPPMQVKVSLTDPDNPASILNLKRTITRRIDTDAATTIDALTRIARRELQKSSGFHRRLTLNTLPDPRRSIREVYRLDVDDLDGEDVLTDTWNVSGWTMDFSDPGGRPQAMSHELSRIDRVDYL